MSGIGLQNGLRAGREAQEVAIASGLGPRRTDDVGRLRVERVEPDRELLSADGSVPGADDLTTRHDQRPEDAVGAGGDLADMDGVSNRTTILVAEEVLVEPGQEVGPPAPRGRRRPVCLVGGEPVVDAVQRARGKPGGCTQALLGLRDRDAGSAREIPSGDRASTGCES